MQRRFNYTDRIRLLHSDVRFRIREEDGKHSFDATLDLGGYDLPGESLVFVEAYRQTVWMRFTWGTVGALQPPSVRLLTEFDTLDDVRFRVRITSPGTADEPHGLLLAEADQVRLRKPEETEDSIDPLLPVLSKDLGAEIWCVEFTDKPRLCLNSKIGSYKKVGVHPGFAAIVYSAATRLILMHILFVLDHRDYDDESDPHSRWLRFAVQVLGVSDPPARDEDHDVVLEWIDTAVAAFSDRHAFLEKFQAFWVGDFPS